MFDHGFNRSVFRWLPQLNAFILMFSVSCPGEALAGQQIDSLPSPQEIARKLRSGTEQERKVLATSLNLNIPARTIEQAARDVPCFDYESVDLHETVLEAPGPQVILLLHSQGCWLAFLVVLERDGSGRWIWRDTVLIHAKYHQPRVEFRTLIRRPEQEIIVHGYEVVSGTGIFQSDLLILKSLRGRLEVIFEEAERVVLAIPTGGNNWENTDQEQNSKFSFVDPEQALGPHTSEKYILEKQTIRAHRTVIVRWREFAWIPELKRFQSAPVSP